LLGYKYDHAPLLAPGRHCLKVPDVFRICVEPFKGPARDHREKLFYSFEEIVQRILQARICCDLVVNGSFFTEKEMPDDVDIKVYIDVTTHALLDAAQMAVYDSLNENHYVPYIDSSAWVTYPRGHPDFQTALDLGNTSEDYGLEHIRLWLKGYGVLMLWETNVGLRIRS
jgi:hypothetical protein